MDNPFEDVSSISNYASKQVNFHLRQTEGISGISFSVKAFVKTDKKIFLDQLERDQPDAKVWLVRETAEYWCKSYFNSIVKYEHITNNFSESYNNWIIKLRDKPLHKFIESMNLMLMKLTYDRRKKAENWNVNSVVPRAKTHIEEMKKYCNQYTPQGADANKWVTISKDGKKWRVDLLGKICDYYEWQILDLPCVHALCVIMEMRMDWVGFCSTYHIVVAYRKSYKGSMLPISNPSLWKKPNSDMLPPPLERGTGGRAARVHTQASQQSTSNARGGLTGGRAARVHTQASQQSTNNARGRLTGGGAARVHTQASQQSTNNVRGGLTRGGSARGANNPWLS
ncbi:hypothetical protein GIB67_032235 [Kingdonia uniflora]|uniref:SWIM-type domain-containing protein n=1 Tax=Kingdonia uniflora TaxID=39325 RepID=A0A7J7MXE8_9MAGN|nr:hypothetical protein GIB67_032235 [Kingdonia uniflora]